MGNTYEKASTREGLCYSAQKAVTEMRKCHHGSLLMRRVMQTRKYQQGREHGSLLSNRVM